MDPSGSVRLSPRATPGAAVAPSADGWRLEIPAGAAGTYRWAQLDDYLELPRRAFAWRPPLRLELEARASARDLPGTWGFGLWNDPFTLSLGIGGAARRVPALPDAAWFFHASPENYLSLRDDLPAQGFLAATFRSRRLWLAPAAPLLPLLAVRPLARWLRRLARRFSAQAAARLDLDPTAWHAYAITWDAEGVAFHVDGVAVLRAAQAPRPPLGLVLWIDNQYAAFTSDGRLRSGTLANPPAWIELRRLRLTAAR